MAYQRDDNSDFWNERGKAEFDRYLSDEEYEDLSVQERREYDDWIEENKKKEVKVESEEEREKRLEKELSTRDETKDQTVRDSEWEAEKKKRIDEYKKLVKKRQEAGVKLSPSDFADEFFFYFETSKDYDERQKKAAEKTQEYERKKAETDSKWAKKIANFYERYVNQFLKGDIFWYEQAISGFLDKKAEEIKGAYMPTLEKRRNFKYACGVKNEFEAQAYLLALCAGGDITEQLIEDYYTTFGKNKGQRTLAPVYDWQTTETRAKDDNDEPAYRYGYIGTVGDMWIEDKIRKEAKNNGRSDTWHSGPRVMVRDKNGNVVGVGFKSPEYRANEADNDLMAHTGRRHEVAMETHLYNTLMIPDDVEKTRLLLEKVHDYIPDKIQNLEIKYQSTLAKKSIREQELKDAFSGGVELGDQNKREIETKVSNLADEAKKLQKQIKDEKWRGEAISRRLKRGITIYQIKSLLLDPDGNDCFIEYNGEKVYEYQMAAELGVRKYWQTRGKSDVRRIIDGEHIKGIERMIFEQLMSDDHREEFRWSCQHHRLGSRRYRIYDETRDGAVQMWDYLNERAVSRQFAVKTRRFEVIEYQEPGSRKKENRVVAYDEDGKGHLLNRSVIDPNDKDALWNYYVPTKKDEEGYSRLIEAPLINLGKMEEITLKNDLSDFAEALSDGKEEVQKTLEDEEDTTFVNGEEKAKKARAEFEEQKKALKKYIPRPNWKVKEGEREARQEFSEEDMKKLEDIIQEMIDKDGVDETKEKLEDHDVIQKIAEKLNLTTDEQNEGLKKALYVFREQTLARWLRGKENIDWIKEELGLAREIADLRLENESDEHFVQRLKYRKKKIEDFRASIPEEDFIDPLKMPTPEQKQKIENIIDDLSGKTLWQLLEELGKQAIAIDLALLHITGGKRGKDNESQNRNNVRGGRTRRGRQRV